MALFQQRFLCKTQKSEKSAKNAGSAKKSECKYDAKKHRTNSYFMARKRSILFAF
jgi:hypothetical protein